MKLSRAAAVTVALGFAAVSSACGADVVCVLDCSRAPGPPPGEVGAQVTFVKSGGVAGVMQTVEIDPKGNVSYSDEVDGGASEAEPLEADAIDALAELLVEPRLRDTDDLDSDQHCADMFVYTLTVVPENSGKDLELTSGECGEHPNETFTEIVDFMYEHTSMGDS